MISRIFALTILGLSIMSCAFAQANPAQSARPETAMPSATTVPPAAQPSANFNPDAATDAYMALIPADARARSDAYFEGGYWLQLWDFLLGSLILIFLLQFGLSARMRASSAQSLVFVASIGSNTSSPSDDAMAPSLAAGRA